MGCARGGFYPSQFAHIPLISQRADFVSLRWPLSSHYTEAGKGYAGGQPRAEPRCSTGFIPNTESFFFPPLSQKMNFGFLLKWEVLWITSTFNSIFHIDKLKLLKKNAPDSVSRNKKHLPA